MNDNNHLINLYGFDERISSDAKQAILQVQSYLDMPSPPCYFPEYTMHGILHINNLIRYSWELLHPDTYNDISDDAVNALVLGICMHDIGMFITENMFESLLDIGEWNVKFEEFIAKLKNMPAKEIDRIYGAIVGSEKEKNKIAKRRENMFSADNIHTVGEFIRRYHHELSYFITINGFPDKSQNICEKIEYKDLVGFVAKGHRGNIRQIIDDEVDTNEDENYSPRGIPIVLLMSLCWLSDELDDKNSYRAPKDLESHINVLNKFSQSQWADNRCVLQPTFTRNKPLISIKTVPESTTQYLRIEGYIKKVQFALDSCWAILSEYCGDRQETHFKLTRHRIVSDILDPAKKAGYDFLTADASLKIKPDIAKLLISPLYGDDPKYGVRELLSNSIDACRELFNINDQIKPTITLNLDTVRKEFTITDNGIGMTGETIVDYFMTIGASFRDSDAWKSKFESDESNTIIRSGRFGVGVLAAYLIGEEISVYTRHYSDEYAYMFTVSLDGSIPDVTKEKNISFFGTKIVIKKLRESVFANKKNVYGDGFDEIAAIAKNLYNTRDYCPWYIYDDISIEYQVDSTCVNVFFGDSFPLVHNEQHIFRPNSNESIRWWFGRYSDGGSLFCSNGIFVQIDYHNGTKFNEKIAHFLREPYVYKRDLSFDFENSHSALSTSNLTLQRNTIIGDAYADKIVLDVIEYLLVELINKGEISPLLEDSPLGILICENGFLPIFVAEYCNIDFQIVKVFIGDASDISETQSEKLLEVAKLCTGPIIFTERDPTYEELRGSFIEGEKAGIYISSDISVSASYRVKPVNGLHNNSLIEGLLMHLFGINRSSSIADCIIPFNEDERRTKFPNVMVE